MQLIGVISSAMIQDLNLQNQICILTFFTPLVNKKSSDPKGTGVLFFVTIQLLVCGSLTPPNTPPDPLPISFPYLKGFRIGSGMRVVWVAGSPTIGILWNFPSFDSLNTQFCKVYMLHGVEKIRAPQSEGFSYHFPYESTPFRSQKNTSAFDEASEVGSHEEPHLGR